MTSDTLIDEPSLREALRPLQPERDEFEAAVRRKLEERERRTAFLVRSPFLRQVAALLPPGLAPTLPAAAAGKQVLAKLAATVFAMPVLVLVMTGVSFVAGLRSLRRLDARHVGAERPLGKSTKWWRAHPLAVLLAVTLFMVLGMTQSIDLLLVLVILSMLVLTWALRRLSAAGLASRRHVGVACGYLLFMLTMGVSPVRDLLGIQHAELQSLLVYTVLFTGGLACYFFAIPAVGDFRTGFTRVGALLVFLPLLAVVVGLQLYIRNPRTIGMTRAELAEYVNTTAPGLDRSPEWRVFRKTALWLEQTGSEELDPTPARVVFRDAFGRGEEISNFVLGDAADLGWLEDEDWGAILDEGRVSRLLAGSGKVRFLKQARALLHGLVAIDMLTEAARDHLADRLIATWDEADSYAQLEDLTEIMRDLELIAREDRIAGLAPDIRTALADAWIAEDLGNVRATGGFALYYRRDNGFANTGADDAAIALMGRVGAPEGIDLVRVHDHLRGEAERSLSRPLSTLDVERALALARFEHRFSGVLPTPPDPSLWDVVLDWRLTIGVCLLVGLCLFATLQAPQQPAG